MEDVRMKNAMVLIVIAIIGTTLVFAVKALFRLPEPVGRDIVIAAMPLGIIKFCCFIATVFAICYIRFLIKEHKKRNLKIINEYNHKL